MLTNGIQTIYRVQPVIIIPKMRDSKSTLQEDRKKKQKESNKRSFEETLYFDVYEKSSNYPK